MQHKGRNSTRTATLLDAALSMYERLPPIESASEVAAKAAAAKRRANAKVLHLPPLDPVRFPDISNPEPNELSFASPRKPKELRRLERAERKAAIAAARKVESDKLAAAAAAVLDERDPGFRLAAMYKRWDENGDGKIDFSEMEENARDEMKEISAPTKEEQKAEAEARAAEKEAKAAAAAAALCLQWTKLDAKPEGGREIANDGLSEALDGGKLIFEAEEWVGFKVEPGSITTESWIAGGNAWYTPAVQAEEAPTEPVSEAWELLDGAKLERAISKADEEVAALLKEHAEKQLVEQIEDAGSSIGSPRHAASKGQASPDRTGADDLHHTPHRSPRSPLGEPMKDPALQPALALPSLALPSPPSGPCVRLLNARFLLALEKTGNGTLPTRSALEADAEEEGAFVDLGSLKQLGASPRGKLRVLCVAPMRWQSADHPDPHATTLHRIALALRALLGHKSDEGTLAVLVDYSSLSPLLLSAQRKVVEHRQKQQEAAGLQEAASGEVVASADGAGKGRAGQGAAGKGAGNGASNPAGSAHDGGVAAGEGKGEGEGKNEGGVGEESLDASPSALDLALAQCASRLMLRLRRHPNVARLNPATWRAQESSVESPRE